jgi:DNA-binding GntR family transcriptional regulator
MGNFDLKPIVKEQTTQEKVYSQIKESILNGVIDSSSVFTEVKLAEFLNTSRTPVRAALQNIEAEGLIVPIHRKGYTVRKVSPEDQEEIFLLRNSIETQVITRVAAIITTKQLTGLHKLLEEQEKAMMNEDGINFIDLDTEFHIRMARIGKYNLIEQILLNLQDLSKLIGLKALSQQGRMKNVLVEHKQIVAALEERDSDLAVQRMMDHLKNTHNTLNLLDHPTV